MSSSETPKHYQEFEQDLTQELLAYFELAASTVGDAARLEELIDDLCCSDETLHTNAQVELRKRQCRYVKHLLKDKDRMTALREVYFAAMDAAYAAGGDYYRQVATKLTELEAHAYDALEQQHYQSFARALEEMKILGDRASQAHTEQK